MLRDLQEMRGAHTSECHAPNFHCRAGRVRRGKVNFSRKGRNSNLLHWWFDGNPSRITRYPRNYLKIVS
jgi:hypothetical protein